MNASLLLLSFAALLAAGLLLLLTIAAVRCLRRRRARRDAEHDAEQDVDEHSIRVIVGLDFSTSMRRKAESFVRGWSKFRLEQQSKTHIRFRLYRVTRYVSPLTSIELLRPEDLPQWNAYTFTEETSPGTALNAFYMRACDKAAQWREKGFDGSIRILLFTDGMPSRTDGFYLEPARESLSRARQRLGCRVQMYAFVPASQSLQVQTYSESLRLSTGANPAAADAPEVRIYFTDEQEDAVEESMSEASRSLELNPREDYTQRILDEDVETDRHDLEPEDQPEPDAPKPDDPEPDQPDNRPQA